MHIGCYIDSCDWVCLVIYHHYYFKKYCFNPNMNYLLICIGHPWWRRLALNFRLSIYHHKLKTLRMRLKRYNEKHGSKTCLQDLLFSISNSSFKTIIDDEHCQISLNVTFPFEFQFVGLGLKNQSSNKFDKWFLSGVVVPLIRWTQPENYWQFGCKYKFKTDIQVYK